MNTLIYVLFALLCAGSIFSNFHHVNDSQIVSKWLFAGVGVGVLLLFVSLKWIGFNSWKRKRISCSVLFVTVLFLCTVQALLDLLQVVGICHSASSYTVTGSFDNPAGFAACLCAGIPFAYPFLKSRCAWIRWTVYAIVLILFVGIVLSHSRAGVVSVLVIAGYVLYPYVRPACRNVCLWLVIPAMLVGVYFLKKDSADGRLLIWRCTCQMIGERPLTGWGSGAFKAHYLDWQAAYFRTHPQSRFAWLADNVNHPFNEYLNVCLMYGIPALLGVFFVCLFFYYCYRKHPSLKAKAAWLSWLVIGVFSLFSYPFNYPFTWIMVAMGGYVLVREARFRLIVPRVVWNVIAIGGIAMSVSLLYIQGNRVLNELEWKHVANESLMGNTQKVLPRYKKLLKPMGDNPYFLYNYAAELYFIGEYVECLKLLKACRQHWADYDLEILFGETYTKLNHPKQAIDHFKLASEMCPIKFVPLYRLYYLYQECGEKEKARETALKIINKKVKVPSFEITKMKAKMKNELNKKE